MYDVAVSPRCAPLMAMLLGVALGSAAARAQGAEPQFPCEPVHGRFYTSNGIPCRLVVFRTRRILAVRNCAELPKPMDRYVSWPMPYRLIYGDYVVCPLETERRGWMRAVKITSASRLVVEDFNPEQLDRVTTYRVTSTWR